MIKALRILEALALWPKSNAFTLEDLRTGEILNCRAPAPRGVTHTDFQAAAKKDHDAMLRIGGRSWEARPAVLRAENGLATAVSYHTFNHSVKVASGAYDIVAPALKRSKKLADGKWDPATLGPGFERDKGGNWNPGSHFCMYYADSLPKSPSAYNVKMQNMVFEAEKLANMKKEDDEVTQEQFDAMMDKWLEKRGKLEESAWSAEEGHFAKAMSPEAKLVNGGRPQSFITREENVALLGRLGLLGGMGGENG